MNLPTEPSSIVQPEATLQCELIRVRGLVQGVGFRPTVYQLAQRTGIAGRVLNDGGGVLIEAEGSRQQLDRFVDDLRANSPQLARIDSIERTTQAQTRGYAEFSIVDSGAGPIHTGIVADAATCPQCLADITDPGNRRHRYAFTNCTHCGPRLSIVRDLPYDRVHTSMHEFEQCPSCLGEYRDPLNRRFHAQPNACPDCGPALQLLDNQGNPLDGDDLLERCAQLIEQGAIVAIKGIGGFQLACDARNDASVQELRRRKHRPSKPLALMGRDTEQVGQFCQLSPGERRQLESSAAPIVVLARKPRASRLSQHLAPGQRSLGFMLPYSPLHHLLMRRLEFPIVLTSGNASDEPQCIDNQQALDKLTGIVDYLLLHNRAIVNRVDDSLVREIDGGIQFYRRARGYAPAPILLPPDLASATPVLALGGELKNTFALMEDNRVTLSQHMGNLENPQTLDDFEHNLELYQRLYRFTPQAIAVDLHPDYFSTRHGRQLARESGLRLVEVQHHHAHIAACLADNGWSLADGAVIGVALDGLGYGDDGSLWGGEFMLADYRGYQRVGHLRPTALPGGARAMLEPWRNLVAQLHAVATPADLQHEYGALELLHYLQGKPWETLQRMIDSGVNSPASSSFGRLFDAVAAALGVCRERISYEGQAASELEALVDHQALRDEQVYPFEIEHNQLLQINPQPMWRAILHDLQQRTDRSRIATRFHATLARMVGAMAHKMRQRHGLDTVALSGGVLQNPSLLTLLRVDLEQRGFNLLIHRQVPANDGGLALGQAAIAATRINQES